jgi:hypothetical protein
MNQFEAAVAYNEYLVNAAIEFWTAMAFPSLYFARNL